MEKNPPRRTGFRGVTSRFLTPDSPETAPTSSGGRAASPLRRKPSDDNAAPTRGLWPSSSKESGTLADHLGSDRLIDLVERQNGTDRSTTAVPPKEEDKVRRLKENRPIGRSIRKLRFPSSGDPEPFTITPARISVDENSKQFRQKINLAAEFRSSESDRSEPKIQAPRVPRTRHYESKSAEGLPTVKNSAESMMKRSNSNKSTKTQWALSPPAAAKGNGRSFSSLRPASPVKGRGVGNFISLGLDLFKRKSSGSSPPSVAAAVSSPTKGGGGVGGEMGHQFRMVHSRLIQWRYVNARTEALNQIKLVHAESSVLGARAGLSKLQASVVQKRVQLEKEKLAFKLNSLLSSQMKVLEGWGDMERQHVSALSATKVCLQSAVCKVPLVDGAKAGPQPLSIELRRATDLTTATIRIIISKFTPPDQKNTVIPLLVELVLV